jgi:hypothetical protein
MVAYYEFCKAAEREFLAHPTLRRGQAYYNILHEMYPEIARCIVGTERDPFYDDAILDDFCTFVYETLTGTYDRTGAR